ncbi:hypothetical protein PanWU01x14_252550 [Parasponia andersonii]|uniref:Uncharacterized protein n=1 Tax=Parasponia andersonii TaxID=3476 RepID=A0A2P5BBZ3_PARAD|nr:hypothetical protein PanWU01x14_252550 [Parasponia andersonii]
MGMVMIRIFILFPVIRWFASLFYGYDPLDPHGNITITWDFILQNGNIYDGRIHLRPWMGSAQSNSYLNSWGSGASKIFRQKTMGDSELLQTQTGHLMRSWVGAHIGQIVLTEQWSVKISPPTDSSHKGQRKAGHDDAREIMITMARDF